MAAISSPSPARRRWHPLAGAAGLTAAALAAAGVALAGGPAWFPLGAWLLMGAAAGFATSGST